MNKSIIALFLCLFFYSSSYAGPKTPSIDEYKNDKSGVYDSYIYGLESGLEWASEYYYRKHQIELFCKPNGIKLPSSRLREIIDREIRKKPGFFDKYKNEPLLGLALRNGYIDEFPCR